MSITFPNLVNWIEEFGFEELHRMHKDFQKYVSPDISFSDFVNTHYECVKSAYEEDVFRGGAVHFKADENGDASTEMAKEALVTIINKGIEEFNIGTVITENELAPDHNSAQMVVDQFWGNVIPAFEIFLKELH